MDYDKISDEALVLLIVENGDVNSYGVIYDRYISKVYQKSLSFVKHKEDAEDLIHDIFLKIYFKLKSYNQKSSFSSWLYAVVNNFLIDFVRKNKRNVVDIDKDVIESSADVEKEISDEFFLN